MRYSIEQGGPWEDGTMTYTFCARIRKWIADGLKRNQGAYKERLLAYNWAHQQQQLGCPCTCGHDQSAQQMSEGTYLKLLRADQPADSIEEYASGSDPE